MTIQRKKELLIGIFVTLYSLLYFLGCLLYINSATPRPILAHVLLLLGGLMWCGLMMVATAFVTHRSGSNIVIALLPSILVVILSRFSVDALLGGLLLFFTLLVLQRRLGRELTTRVRLQIIPIFYGPSKLTLFALAIALITLFLPNLNQQVQTGSIGVPSSYLQVVLIPFEPLIASTIPGYTTKKTIDEIIDTNLEQQAASLPLGPITGNAQHNLVKTQLSQQFGVPISGQETVADIVTKVINKNIATVTRENKYATTLLVIGTLILLMKAVVPFIAWPSLVFVQLFLYISIQIGLISLVKTQVEVDRFSL